MSPRPHRSPQGPRRLLDSARAKARARPRTCACATRGSRSCALLVQGKYDGETAGRLGCSAPARLGDEGSRLRCAARSRWPTCANSCPRRARFAGSAGLVPCPSGACRARGPNDLRVQRAPPGRLEQQHERPQAHEYRTIYAADKRDLRRDLGADLRPNAKFLADFGKVFGARPGARGRRQGDARVARAPRLGAAPGSTSTPARYGRDRGRRR